MQEGTKITHTPLLHVSIGFSPSTSSAQQYFWHFRSYLLSVSKSSPLHSSSTQLFSTQATLNHVPIAPQSHSASPHSFLSTTLASWYFFSHLWRKPLSYDNMRPQSFPCITSLCHQNIGSFLQEENFMCQSIADDNSHMFSLRCKREDE